MRLNSILLTLAMLFSPSVLRASELINIGSGGVSGVYFPTAVAICKLMNRSSQDSGLRCNPRSTPGSIYNLNMLRDGRLQFALAQSDWHFMAMKGAGNFENPEPFENMRSVMSFYPEPFSVLVRENSSFQSFNDLKGSNVNFGPIGTGQRATSDLLVELAGWTDRDLMNRKELSSDHQSRALCSGQIDAMLYLVGHPSEAINSAISMCNARLIPVEEVTVNRLIANFPFYRKVEIPGGLYPYNADAVMTFGVAATLVTHVNISEQTVYELTRTVFENLELLKKLHPALTYLQKEEMQKDALTAPLHIGAQRYYDQIR